MVTEKMKTSKQSGYKSKILFCTTESIGINDTTKTNHFYIVIVHL